MHRLAVRRLSVNAFPKRPGAYRRPMAYCRVDGVWGGASMASGMAHIDWTQSTRLHRHRERKKTKKNTGANFIPLTPLAFIDRARHVFADGPAVVNCVEINQCVGCRR